MKPLLTIRYTVDGDCLALEFNTIVDPLTDEILASEIDKGAQAELWTGQLRLTGKPITTAKQLHEALVVNSETILRRLL